MPIKTRKKPATKTATSPVISMTIGDIDHHPLLTDEQRSMAKTFLRLSKKEKKPFTMLQFSELALRAEARDLAAEAEGEISAYAMADDRLRRTAVLYVHEALLACPAAIVNEWAGMPEMLNTLMFLMRDLP